MRIITFSVIVLLVSILSASLVYAELKEEEGRKSLIDIATDIATLKTNVGNIKETLNDDIKPKVNEVPGIRNDLDRLITKVVSIETSSSLMQRQMAEIRGGQESNKFWLQIFIVVVIGCLLVPHFLELFRRRPGETTRSGDK